MTIALSNIFNQRRATHEENFTAYARLLALSLDAGGALSAANERKLCHLLGLLGITEAEAMEHARVLTEARNLAPLAADVPDAQGAYDRTKSEANEFRLETTRRVESKRAELRAIGADKLCLEVIDRVEAEIRAVESDRRGEGMDLDRAAAVASARLEAARSAVKRLAELRKSHARLLEVLP